LFVGIRPTGETSSDHEKRADSPSAECQPFGYTGHGVSFLPSLPSQGCDFLRTHRPVEDADIVDQAGEEGAWGKIAAGAEIQVAI